jgi:hypothetical protein
MLDQKVSQNVSGFKNKTKKKFQFQHKAKIMNKRHHSLTIDVEAISDLHLLAVGVVVCQHSPLHLIEKQCFAFCTDRWKGQSATTFWAEKSWQRRLMELDEGTRKVLQRHAGFNEKTFDFWVKHVKTLEHLERCAVEQQRARETKHETKLWTEEQHIGAVLHDIHTFIGKMLGKYKDIRFLGDNPAFDVGMLDCFFLQHGLSSIRKNPKGQVIHVECIYSSAGALTGKSGLRCKAEAVQEVLNLAGSRVIKSTNHDPVDDCLFVIQVYEAILKVQAQVQAAEWVLQPSLGHRVREQGGCTYFY